MKINKSVFRYIEHELYSYDQTKKDLILFREQVIEGTVAPDVAVQSGPGDVTGSKAIKLTSSAFVARAEQVIRAVTKSLDLLTPAHKQLFTLKYRDCEQWSDITIYMGISDRTYYRIRRELVIAVAQQLGLINANWEE